MKRYVFIIILVLGFVMGVSTSPRHTPEFFSEMNGMQPLIASGSAVYRRGDTKPFVLRGAVSDYFRFVNPYDPDPFDEGILGEIARTKILQANGLNVMGFYMSNLTAIKQHIAELDHYVQYAYENNIYVYFMPVARDFVGKPSSGSTFATGNFNDLTELVRLVADRYKQYPNIMYGFGAEPDEHDETFESWNEKQRNLAKIVEQHVPNPLLLVSTIFYARGIQLYESNAWEKHNVMYFGGGYITKDHATAMANPKLVREIVDLVINQTDLPFPVLVAEFGGYYGDDFSTAGDLALIDELLDGLTAQKANFTAYRLSPYYANDPLALFTSDNQLTERGKLFSQAFKK